MDLTGVLLRAGAARPHVLAVTMPGATAVRLEAEEQVRRLGWPTALTPADADILLVAGSPAGPLADVVEAVWKAMSAPRARALAVRPGEVTAGLQAARTLLADRVGQQTMAAVATVRDRHARAADGVPMAGRGEDRDGLKLDLLHLPLGPALPDWPAGLVLRCTLQGDVIQCAEPEVLGGGGGSFWDEPWHKAAAGQSVTTAEAARRLAAARLDSLGRFLAVAGWDAAATAAWRLRGEVLSGTPPVQRDVRRLARRVARSRALAWLTGGLGVLTAAEAAAAGVTGPALRSRGDVTTRYRCWCEDLEAAAAAFGDVSPLDPARLEPPRGPATGSQPPSARLIAVLPGLLAGSELAAARLIVASLDPDLDQLPVGAEAGRGH